MIRRIFVIRVLGFMDIEWNRLHPLRHRLFIYHEAHEGHED
jgi:hypothetical protein